MANPQVQKFKKDLVLKSAHACFSASSFEEVTMDDIAAEAGFSKATLYQFFESKDAMLFHILRDSLESVGTQIQSIIDDMREPDSALDKVIDLNFKGFRANSGLVISLIRRREAGAGKPEWTEEIRRLLQKKIRLMADILQAGMNEGLLIQQDPVILAQILDDMIRSNCIPSLTRSFSNDEEELSIIKFIIFHGIKKNKEKVRK